MVGVYQSPYFTGLQSIALLVDKVTALTIVAVTFFGECVTSFGLVGSIMFHVDPQLFRAMSKLALLAVGAVSFFSEIFAK